MDPFSVLFLSSHEENLMQFRIAVVAVLLTLHQGQIDLAERLSLIATNVAAAADRPEGSKPDASDNVFRLTSVWKIHVHVSVAQCFNTFIAEFTEQIR